MIEKQIVLPKNPINQNFFRILRDLTPKPQAIATDNIRHLSDQDRLMLTKIGLTAKDLIDKVALETTINWDRQRLYGEITKAIDHWFVGPALQLYSDYSTQFNSIHNASVWITAKDSVYQKELTRLLERIGIEEKINDWANTVAAFGDLFVELKAQPGLGIYAINDDEHPLNVSRIEHDGCLIGFYKTPQGNQPDIQETSIMSPWAYSHFRVLGTKRRRPLWGDPQYTEYRTMTLITGADTKAITSRYGASLIQDALPAWKRLRMAEDSLLMSAVLRRPVRYIFKLMTSSQNAESVNAVMELYKAILMKARALDTRSDSPNYESKFNPLAAVENILMPVWNDNGGDMKIEKLGGDVDIKWIADIEELRNQLSCTLRVPLSLLGAFPKEATGGFTGGEAMEQLDIGFARNARKLGRSLRQGIKRICQVHLAFMNMDPDPSLFDVEMSEGNSTIEDQTRETMDKGLDVVDKMLDVLDKAGVHDEGQKKDVTNYLIKKVLKLDDFDLNKFTGEGKLGFANEKLDETKLDENQREVLRIQARRVDNCYLFAYLPINESHTKGVLSERGESNWRIVVPETTKVKIQVNPEPPKQKSEMTMTVEAK